MPVDLGPLPVAAGRRNAYQNALYTLDGHQQYVYHYGGRREQEADGETVRGPGPRNSPAIGLSVFTSSTPRLRRRPHLWHGLG